MSRTIGYYRLDPEHHVVPCNVEDVEARLVEHTVVSGECNVSTVFLGLDHRWSRNGPPILFETKVFGGPMHGEMRRYSRWDDAETGHKIMVSKVLSTMKEKAK